MLKVNLASGNIFEPSWINVDKSILNKVSKHKLIMYLAWKLGLIDKSLYVYNIKNRKWPKKVVNANLKKRLPFKTGSVDFLFCSYFLEHLTPNETNRFLRECRRIIKPGGYFRVIVPDLEAHTKAYLARDKKFFNITKDTPNAEDFSDCLNGIFYNVTYSKKSGCRITKIMDLFSGPNTHRWHYDFETLKIVLERNGFKNCKRMKYLEGKTPNLDVLDHDGPTNLIIECQG